MKALFLATAFSLALISGAAAQVDTEVNGTIIYNTDTGKVSGNVGAQATQTRGDTTTRVGVQYDGQNVQGKVSVKDNKTPEPPKR